MDFIAWPTANEHHLLVLSIAIAHDDSKWFKIGIFQSKD